MHRVLVIAVVLGQKRPRLIINSNQVMRQQVCFCVYTLVFQTAHKLLVDHASVVKARDLSCSCIFANLLLDRDALFQTSVKVLPELYGFLRNASRSICVASIIGWDCAFSTNSDFLDGRAISEYKQRSLCVFIEGCRLQCLTRGAFRKLSLHQRRFSLDS